MSWNAAAVSVYTRVDPESMPGYLCIYVEHRRIPRQREGEGEGIKRTGEGTRENKESEKGGFSREKEERGRKEEPMASQGVLPFRYEGASR